MSRFERPPPEFRGIFGEKGDSANWIDTVSKFPNGVPRFNSKEECLQFMKDYNTYNGGSNPEHPQLKHIFTMLISWDQIESILLPAIRKAREEPSFANKVPRDYDCGSDPDSTNVYEHIDTRDVFDALAFRLNVPFHKCTNPVSTMNTLKYLYYHMKCGIFVMIRNRKVRIFCPFVNGDYRNTWAHHLKVEGDQGLDAYYQEKRKYYRRENIEHDMTRWWANGNIICNELTQERDKKNMQYWGDQFLSPLRDMLSEACNQRDIPDCEFFLNKRDYPQLKVNIPRGGVPVEPYGFIFDKDDRDPDQDVDLYPDHKFNTYAPIVSFYAAAEDRFTDLPWPSSEDWEGACGLVFPQTFMHNRDRETGEVVFNGNPRDLFTESNFRKFERGWDDDRVHTAFFRGTATGGGTTIHNNQRLMVAHLSHEWKNDPEKGGEEPFLDAAIVGWNLRDKKVAETPMSYLRPKKFKFTAGRHHFTPIYEQSKYKYLVYVDGHCAACRYGFMMRLGSVILKVEPRQVADRMWYFPILKPYYDHVPVKSDLSDLEDRIRWCRENDDKCREIAQNCLKVYEKYVARNGLLDYVEMTMKQIAQRYIEPPSFYEEPPAREDPPQLRKPDEMCYKDRDTRQGRMCARCQEQIDEEQKQEQEIKKKEKSAKGKKRKSKQSYRDRMKKRAMEAAKKN